MHQNPRLLNVSHGMHDYKCEEERSRSDCTSMQSDHTCDIILDANREIWASK